MRVNKVILAVLLALSISSAWAASNVKKVVGRPLAHDLTFQDMEGNKHKISEYRGKVVVVNYFATWCAPCREEMPSLNKAWAKVKDGNVVMLAISGREKAGAVREFVKEQPIDFMVLLDESGQVFNEWPIVGIPTTLILDKEGRITYRTVGKQNWDDNAMLRPIYLLEYGKLVD